MALTKLTADVENITPLSNRPNSIEGLTADELKAKYDKAGVDIKEYINQTLTEEIDNEISKILTGWIEANETWTYESIDDPTGVISITGNKTSKYSAGMRIKFNNSGHTIYGIITAVSYSNPNTLVTFLHEIDPTDNQALHLLQNSAISNNYYSMAKSPIGFPLDPNKWSIVITNSSSLAQTSPDSNTWYNLGSLKIDVPIGAWDLGYFLVLGGYKAASTSFGADSTLSTTNNSETDKDFSGTTYIEGATSTLVLTGNIYKKKRLTLTSKTTYYLIGKANGTALNFYGNISPTKIFAVCTYL